MSNNGTHFNVNLEGLDVGERIQSAMNRLS